MSDFTSLNLQANTGTSDASPTWTNLSFGTAGYEIRFCASGAGAGTTASASWPTYLRPGSVGVVPELWAFTADTTGSKVTTYDGTSAHYAQFRINWDATGTFAAANVLSFWMNNTLPAASPGTQPSPTAGGDGSSIVNGQSSDTSSTSYMKMNAYGSGVTAAGSQETPSANAGGTLSATSGTAGAATPAAASWLSTWQSGQAATQYIQGVATPKATTAGQWYFLLSLYTGPNMVGGTLLPVLGFQYQWV